MPPPRRGRPRSGRGASFAPPELRGTLGTLLRTTLAQASAVRDALERGAREGRARIDDVRHERRRQETLAELGELVLERVRRGELTELEELPEAAEVLAALEDMDRRDDPRRGRDWVAPKERSRFDRVRGDDDDGAVSSASWTPPPAKDPDARVWRPDQAENPPDRKKGGIVFSGDDDEDDLADYMHPDDVPPKK